METRRPLKGTSCNIAADHVINVIKFKCRLDFGPMQMIAADRKPIDGLAPGAATWCVVQRRPPSDEWPSDAKPAAVDADWGPCK